MIILLKIYLAKDLESIESFYVVLSRTGGVSNNNCYTGQKLIC